MKKAGRSNDTSVIPFIPENPINKNILKKFMDEESADVVFEVGGGNQHGGNTRKKAKITPTKFYAHRLILQDGAPMLAELCKSGGGELATISIANIKPDIFRQMLYCVRGEAV